MDLSIIIVNWNTKTYLKWCLHYVYKRTKDMDFEVFVVDNASEDGSTDMVEHDFPQVNLIKNKKNNGFAKANNQAIKKAKGRYILLLNSDTKILDESMETMLKYMDENKKCGVLGCKLLNPDMTLQPSCRRFPTLWSQVLILTKIHNIFPGLKSIKNYLMFNFAYNKERKVDQVMGACFMIRREVIDKIGVLDEGFFFWFEEVDYCKRVKEAGFDVCFIPDAKIIHEKAASVDQVFSIKKQKMMNNSMLRYFRKHHSVFAFLIILFLYPLSILLAGFVQIVLKIKPIEKNKKL